MAVKRIESRTCEMDGYDSYDGEKEFYWHCEDEATTAVIDRVTGKAMYVCRVHAIIYRNGLI